MAAHPDPRALVLEALAPIAPVTEVAAGETVEFRLADGTVLCAMAATTDGQPVLWFPTPAGVADEMVTSEPGRFVRPGPTDDGAAHDDRWPWLGLRLDGRGIDAPELGELEAMLSEAFAVVTESSGDGADDGSGGPPFRFGAELWLYPGGNWQFVTLPPATGRALATAGAHLRAGFGSIKVRATLGSTTWDTSVFPDSDSGSFLLPVKKAVRRREGVDAGDRVEIAVEPLDLTGAQGRG